MNKPIAVKMSTPRFARLRKVLLWFGALLAYYVLFQSFYNLVAYRTIWPYTPATQAWVDIGRNFMFIAIVYVIDYYIIFCRPHSVREHSEFVRIVVDVVLSSLWMIIINLFFIYVTDLHLDWAGTFFNNIFIFLGMEMIQNGRISQSTKIEAETYRAEMLQYQYQALKAQVNPHFLFNSLNILYSLIQLEPSKAREFTMALSQIYRYIMLQQGHTTVPLESELKFLQSYAEVLQIRYNDNFRVVVSGLENVGKHEVITYCLQLLLENVTKHNTITASQPMTVEVVCGPDSVSVTNPIRARHSESSSGFGLSYIATLNEQAGKAFTYTNDGTTFCAVLPYIK